MADTAGRWPLLLDVTSDLVYVRLHGDTELYRSGYSEGALDVWAERVRGGGGTPASTSACTSTTTSTRTHRSTRSAWPGGSASARLRVPVSDPPSSVPCMTQNSSGTPDASDVPDPSTWRTGDEPPTQRQRAYLETLAQEAGEQLPDDLTKAEASDKIDELRQETGRE